MDISFLLFLQGIREATGGIFNEFFNGVSKVAVDVAIFIPFIVYWCVDKKWGQRFIATYTGTDLINGIIKLTVCAYRPWIRSDLINPAGDSKKAATGYSFPSGHTSRGTAIYGSVVQNQWNKRRWLSILCIVGIILTGFSRVFLGVHTPQDVLVGLLEASLIIFIAGKIQEAADKSEKSSAILSVLGLLLVIGTLVYIQVKPYPMDYVEGKLLVDPQKMMNDCFKACGAFTGMIAAFYVDRRFVHYEIPFKSKNLPLLTAIGTCILLSWKKYFAEATVIQAFGGHWGNFLANFIFAFAAIALYPIFIMKKAEE
ncbi:MAG: phosphatase PAP2 family protein [Treponema sp.]|nr:phosphatase PAP2 family protein [Treponema sp.]